MKNRISFYLAIIFYFCYTSVDAQLVRCNTKSEINTNYHQKHTKFTKRSPLKFQLVFHVLYTNELENISSVQIHSQVRILNELFHPINPDQNKLIPQEFKSFVADPNFTFCLATEDPSGNSSSGVTRTKISDISIACKKQFGKRNLMHDVLGGKTIWDPKKYINVYVVNRTQCSVLGEAIFPWDATEGEDGIILDYRTVGYTGQASCNHPFHLGKTLVHELGHYFGLLHLSADRNDCSGEDGIADTPQQAGEYFGCPDEQQFTCGSSDMYMNYMSLVDDGCLLFFTKLQMAKMNEVIAQYRPELASNLCESGGDSKLADVFAVHDKGYWLFATKNNMEWTASIQMYDLMGRMIWNESERTLPKRIVGHPNTEYASSLFFIVLKNTNESKTFTLLKY